MTARVLLYGATGYTGRLIAAHLAGKLDLVLAGRDPAKLAALAEPLGLAWRAFPLDHAAAIAGALRDIDVVLHAAGPFAQTALPMAQACIASGTHYLDLGGEWTVFQDLLALDGAAKAADVMLLPGVGLTVATTDCLLKRAVELWPDTVRLCLGISHPQIISRGSISTMASMTEPTVPIRQGGRLVTVPAGSMARSFDFGGGLSDAVAISWADVVTAGISTGVADVEVYSELHWAERAAFRMGGIAMSLWGSAAMRAAGGAMASAWNEGPSPQDRQAAWYSMVAIAIDPWRRERRLTMLTRDGYSASVLTAAEALHSVLGGEARPGFQTPSLAFGSDFAVRADAARFGPSSGRTAA